jgi:hypothetical protein
MFFVTSAVHTKKMQTCNKIMQTAEKGMLVNSNPFIFSSFFFNISKTDSYFFSNNIGLKYILRGNFCKSRIFFYSA